MTSRAAWADPWSRRAAIAARRWWRELRHEVGTCPRAQLGYWCDGTPGRCGWDD